LLGFSSSTRTAGWVWSCHVLIGFALSCVVKAGVATAPAGGASNANGDNTVGGEG
jgi:hypothetical protein